jgi:hypothetical protein
MTNKPANHKSYRKAADDLFMPQWRGLPCEVCGKEEGTVGHHFISKGRSKALRYERTNIVILCPGHHNHGAVCEDGGVIGAHSLSNMDQERFIEWFKENCPGRYEWLKENEHIERRYTYRQAVENLKEGKEAWE